MDNGKIFRIIRTKSNLTNGPTCVHMYSLMHSVSNIQNINWEIDMKMHLCLQRWFSGAVASTV